MKTQFKNLKIKRNTTYLSTGYKNMLYVLLFIYYLLTFYNPKLIRNDYQEQVLFKIWI